MKAGRELDALVAEKVMGWKHVQTCEPYEVREPGDGGIYINYHREDYWKRPDHDLKLPLNHFSTSITDAWLVVEKMGLWHGFEFIMFREHDSEDETKLIWRVGWFEWGYDGPESRVCALAETAPLAICLAALKAVGVEVERDGQGEP